MGAAACAAARACGYTGAGTVEFIVAGDPAGADEWFFMEMNTRLQVEHPVTEEVTGLDLVELQLRVAAGEPLPLTQDDVVLRGHASRPGSTPKLVIPWVAGFLPTGGRVLALHEPRDLPGVRVDSGIAAGFVVGSDYDPMLSKIVAHGADRAEALHRLDAALRRTVLLGLGTNIGFLRALLADPDVRAGNLDTGLVGRRVAELAKADLPDDVVGRRHRDRAARPGAPRPGRRPVRHPRRLARRRARLDHPPGRRRRPRPGRGPLPGPRRLGRADDRRRRAAAACPPPPTTGTPRAGHPRLRRRRSDDGVLWVSRDGRSWAIREQEAWRRRRRRPRAPAARCCPDARDRDGGGGRGGPAGDGGAAARRVEAMKMEHVLTAPVDGTVRELRARPGAAVAKDAVLLVVEADGERGQVQDGRVSG